MIQTMINKCHDKLCIQQVTGRGKQLSELKCFTCTYIPCILCEKIKDFYCKYMKCVVSFWLGCQCQGLHAELPINCVKCS